MGDTTQYSLPTDWQQPTIRQLKFLVSYAKTKNKSASAVRAWPKADLPTLTRLAKTTLSMPVATEILNQVKVDVTSLAKAHERLLYAKKKVNLGGFIEEVPNDEVRMRAVETGYRVHGVLSSKDAPSSTTNIAVNNVDPEKLAAVVARLGEISNNLKTKAVPTGEVIDVEATHDK